MAKPIEFSGGGGGGGNTTRPDTFKSKDTVELILGLGEGPWWGPAEGAKSIYLDQTPIVNAAGYSNFKDMNITFYPGSDLGEEIKPHLGGFSSPVAVNVSLEKDVAVTRTGIQTELDLIELRLVVQSLYKNHEEKGQLATKATVKIEYKATSSATWLPAVLSIESAPASVTGPAGSVVTYTVNDTNNVTDAVGGVILSDTPPPIPVDPRVVWVDPTDGYQPHILDAPGTAWVANGTFDALTNTWSFDSPFGFAPTNIMTLDTLLLPNLEGDGDPVRPGDIRISDGEIIRIYDGDTWGPTYERVVFPSGVFPIDEKITMPSVREVRFAVPSIEETYDIRVTMLTDNTTEERVAEIQFESFQEIKTDPYTFPGTACLQFLARAGDQFSGLPTVQGIYKGRICRVPTNYNPTTRVYTGVWDGLFQMAWTDNPAWVFLDFVEHNRFGLSRIYPHTCNKWSIYDWAVYCDEMVPDGSGGTRPRWTFNQITTEPRPAKEFAQFIAGAGGARYYDDGNGLVDVIFDNPEDQPVALFVNENVVEGMFEYSHTDRQTRANQIVVTFKNPDLFYRPDTRLVQDLDDQDVYGVIPDEFTAEGCRNLSEALSRARMRLITNLTEKEFVSFRTQRKGRYLRPWDIILVADADAGHGVSGRIVSHSVIDNTVTLAAPIALEVGVTYSMTFDIVNPAYPDTSNEPFITFESEIVTTSGTHTVLELADTLPDLVEDCVYALHAPEVLGLPKAFRVLKIEADQADPDRVTIEAFEINRTKYAYIDGTADLLTDDDTSAYYNGVIEPVTGFRMRMIRAGRTRTGQLLWNRSPSKYVARYEIAYSKTKGPITVLGSTTDTSFEIENLTVYDYEFYITPIDVTGKRGPRISIYRYQDTPQRLVQPPTGLALKGQVGTVARDKDIAVTWNAPPSDPLFFQFVMEVYEADGTTLKRSVNRSNLQEWTYKYDQHEDDGLDRTVVFKLFCEDIEGNRSVPATLTVTKPPPVITGASISFSGVRKTVTLSYTVDAPFDYQGVRIYYVPGAHDYPAIDPANLAYEGLGSPQTFKWDVAGADAYFVIVPVDMFGADVAGAYSTGSWLYYSEPAIDADTLNGETNAELHKYSNLTGKPSTFTPSAHTHTAADVISGVFPHERLGTGGGGASKFLREDGTYQLVGGGGAWGSITGTLSSQTDLQAALDLKADADHDVKSVASATSVSDIPSGVYAFDGLSYDSLPGFGAVLGAKANTNRQFQIAAPSETQMMFRRGHGTFGWDAWQTVWHSGTAINGPNGTAALPAYSFAGDPNTGFYWVSADLMGYSSGGALRFNISDYFYGTATGSAAVRGALGTAALPAFTFLGDTNTGLYWIGADNFGISLGGTARVEFNNSTTQTLELLGQINLTTALGTLRSKLDWGITQSGLTISNEDNTPFYFRTSALNRMTISAVGNVGIGTTSPADFGAPGWRCLQIGDTGVNGALRLSSGTVAGDLWADTTAFYLRTATNHPMHFRTNDTTRLVIAATGECDFGTATKQSAGLIRVRRNGDNIEFGHTNTAGYGSFLGNMAGNGAPVLGFNCLTGTTNNTFKTAGIKGSVLRSNNAGGFEFASVDTAAATDNQTPTNRMTLNAGGTLTVTLVNATSDRRIKTNIRRVGGMLARIMKLNPSLYFNTEVKEEQFGLIAQDVEEVFPELVTTVDDWNGIKDFKTLDYARLSVALIGAIQEQQAEIEKLKRRRWWRF